jgi:hypothetical protein
VDVIPPGADKFLPAFRISAGGVFAPEPGIIVFGSMGFGAPVFVFEFERDRTEQPCTLLAHIACQEKGPDILAYPVVQVWMPALCLVFEGFPADEDVDGGLAHQDGGQFGLEPPGRAQSIRSPRLVAPRILILLLNPVAQVAVGQLLEGGVIQLMVIDQGMKPIGPPIPEMPDKGPVVKEFGMLEKELVPQPVFEGPGFAHLEPGRDDKRPLIKRAILLGPTRINKSRRRLRPIFHRNCLSPTKSIKS